MDLPLLQQCCAASDQLEKNQTENSNSKALETTRLTAGWAPQARLAQASLSAYYCGHQPAPKLGGAAAQCGAAAQDVATLPFLNPTVHMPPAVQQCGFIIYDTHAVPPLNPLPAGRPYQGHGPCRPASVLAGSWLAGWRQSGRGQSSQPGPVYFQTSLGLRVEMSGVTHSSFSVSRALLMSSTTCRHQACSVCTRAERDKEILLRIP